MKRNDAMPLTALFFPIFAAFLSSIQSFKENSLETQLNSHLHPCHPFDDLLGWEFRLVENRFEVLRSGHHSVSEVDPFVSDHVWRPETVQSSAKSEKRGL